MADAKDPSAAPQPSSPYKFKPGPAVPKQRAPGQSYIEEINKYAPAFFEADENVRNVITVNEFNRYLPLFDREKMSKLPKEQVAELSYEYTQRFSAYYPIRVIDPDVIDEARGFVWKEGDGRKHKVVHLIRARLHRLNTVDVLGGEAGDIASSYMFNARQSNNPFDTRLSEYSDAIGKMVTMANKDTIAKQDAEFDTALKSLRGTTSQPTSKETSSDDPQGLDCDWE